MSWLVGPGAATVDSLPPADDRLFGPHAYGPGWLALGVVCVLGALALAIWSLRRPSRPPAAGGPSLLPRRQRYLHHLDELEHQFATRRVDSRAVHHELSRTLRRFAAEVGTARAPSMSAGQLDDAGHRSVATAVRRYELPQFAREAEQDPVAAIGLARRVVTEAEAERAP